MVKAPKINITENRKKLPQMIKLLAHHYRTAKTALHFGNPLQMLVSTILSAQCTDVRVNKVTPLLFQKYKTAKDYATAKPEELQAMIRSTGFFRNKAKSIMGATRVMVEKFDGKVPNTMEKMLQLPGVARKTANVVLNNAYGIVEGVVVDTHVRRLSRRLGLTSQQNPEKIEQDLMKVVPRKDWGYFPYWLVDHGRSICKSQKPDCRECFLNQLCSSAFHFDEKGRWIGIK